MNFEAMTDAEKAIYAQGLIDARQKADAAGENPSNPPATPIKLDFGTGPTEFKSLEELEQSLKGYFAAQENVMRDLMNRTPPQPTTPEPKQNQFDKTQYYKLLESDPLAAQDYVDSYRLFNGTVERPSEILREVSLKVAEISKNWEIEKFLRLSNDFLPSPENAQALEFIRQKMNVPVTAEGLVAAFEYGKKHNAFKLADQTNNTNQTSQNNFNQAMPFAAPPQLPRQTPDIDASQIEEQLENMSLEELTAFARRTGAKTY